MKRKSILSMAACLILVMVMLVGCGKGQKTSDNEMKTEDGKTYITVETEYGDLYYQEQWVEFMKTETKLEEDVLKVDFKAEIEGSIYDLFQLSIGVADEEAMGTLKDSEGNERKVSVMLYELEQKSELSEDEMNRLYALQEEINFVMEHLDGMDD